ncbi:hypothetical protein SARC_07327 [Sphaeroforma arctica JP610]|uniref:F-box domain-containing protein n=1 Tax=Sphaeroforma arctica JP610 TaxID=667725 RepID=A0A0L0FUH4_9EUKA|nr:hypothetical protein SARC_07327 [Sphaeroforma arctica JP610]KNC80314.1 hypothetical protein SARC_07327 [Sphaeroforma arctica JP610]|eukprot:XP_014154216.1 hypothetical protein SARC_07327 [Sphaeroforma arctica JP610]
MVHTLLNIPAEVRLKALGYLKPTDYLQASLVCTQLSADCADEDLIARVLFNAVRKSVFHARYHNVGVDDLIITSLFTTSRQDGFVYDDICEYIDELYHTCVDTLGKPRVLFELFRILDLYCSGASCKLYKQPAPDGADCTQHRAATSLPVFPTSRAIYLLVLRACYIGWADVVQVYLEFVTSHPSEHTVCLDIPLQLACKHGYTSIVRMLLKHGKANPNAAFGKALSLACAGGYTAIVQLLIDDGRCDPALSDSESLLEACFENHIDIVRILLSDRRCDPAAVHSFALVKAISNVYVDIVKLLLDDRRADPCALNSRTWWEACGSGSLDVVHLLIEDNRVDMTRGRALKEAVAGGQIEVVRLLLEQQLIDPSDPLVGDIVRVASEKGYTHVVRLLLEDGRALVHKGLGKAVLYGHTDIVRMLVNDGRADACPAKIMMKARRKGFNECARMVLSYKRGPATDGPIFD